MEFLVFLLGLAVWLTILTFRTREQKRITEKMRRDNQAYLAEIRHLKEQLYGKEESEKRKG